MYMYMYVPVDYELTIILCETELYFSSFSSFAGVSESTSAGRSRLDYSNDTNIV